MVFRRSAVGEGEGGRMGSNSEQYCLRWNSYETNILDTFGGLLASEALSDVTLFCEGNFKKKEPNIRHKLLFFWTT